MHVIKLSGCLHVLKCNSWALVVFHMASGGCSNWRPFPLAAFSGCSGLKTIFQVRIYCAVCYYPPSDHSPLSCTCRPSPPDPGPFDRDTPSETLWEARAYDGTGLVWGQHRCLVKGLAWAPRLQNSATNSSKKEGDHSASWKRGQLQKSWVLIPRLCNLTKASLSSPRKWGILQTAGPEVDTRIERPHLQRRPRFGCQRSDRRPDSFLLCPVAWRTGMQ